MDDALLVRGLERVAQLERDRRGALDADPAFAAELEAASNKARDKAITAVNREAKFEVEMLEKEHDGNVKVFELKVQTLEERIARQSTLITDLNTKLDATIAKSQGLAEQAFKRPNSSAGA